MIKVNLHDLLIGDFLGSVPAAQAFAKENNACFACHPEVKELFEMTGLTPYNPAYHITKEINVGCTDAWNIAIPKELHMTQAYFPLLGLDIPDKPVKAELRYPAVSMESFHYIFAPFSRSLPDKQKLSQKQWQRLADLLPDKRIAVIGSEQNELGFIKGDNVTEIYGHSFTLVLNLLRRCDALISVVSGPSHMAFHLGAKNILITNQGMNWGNNPDAVRVSGRIPDLKAEDIMMYL